MRSKPIPENAQDLIRELFEYDPAEPLALRWKICRSTKFNNRAGQIAGFWHADRGGSAFFRRYVRVPWSDRYPAHYAVWIYVNGTSPPHTLGFRNGDLGDCRIENLGTNLRLPTKEQLQIMQKKYNIRFKSSFTVEEWSRFLRKRNLRRDYLMTEEEWNWIFAKQNGVCAICANPETQMSKGKPRELSVDHCHETGKIRGLLCASCNNGIGRFAHDPARLRAAADYLEAAAC